MGSKIGDAKETNGNCTTETEDHPGHTDATCIGDRLHRAGGHETRQNMRLPHVAQTPSHQRENADAGSTAKHVAVVDVDPLDHGQGLIKTAQLQHHNDGRQQQGKDHQSRLHGIGPADRQKTPNEYIEDGGGGTGPQRRIVA